MVRKYLLLTRFSGIRVSIMTYDKRFQVGVSVDKAVISAKNDVSELCGNILKQIGLMYKELQEAGVLQT